MYYVTTRKKTLTAPVMTQFFLATNLDARTGKSQTSKVFTKVWKKGVTHINRNIQPYNIQH